MNTAVSIYRKEMSPAVYSYSLSLTFANSQGIVISTSFCLISEETYNAIRGIRPESYNLEQKTYSVNF